jgi:hypothetical protein
VRSTYSKEVRANASSDRRPYDLLKASVVQFVMGFEILPGTKGKSESPKMTPFEQAPPAASDGG